MRVPRSLATPVVDKIDDESEVALNESNENVTGGWRDWS